MPLRRPQVLALAGAILATLGLSGLSPRSAQAGPGAEKEAVEEILQILADRGILSEAEHVRLATKVQTAKSERGTRDVAAQLLDGLEWSGDLRLRYEAFYFDNDSRGFDEDNRYRFRYRARLGFKKKINDWATVAMRFASGEDDHRSANQTLGKNDPDFDPDDIFIDRAYAELRLPERHGVKAKIHAGKVPNPFVWKHGKDLLIMEKDINPEGGTLLAYRPLSERTDLFLHVGGYILSENQGKDNPGDTDQSSDPKVFGVQLGGTSRLSDTVEGGLRLSGYEWRSLDSAFITRATGKGNLTSAFDGRARLGNVTGFLNFACSDNWPLKVYGTYIRNFTADPAVVGGFLEDEEDTAWGGGLEIGSPKNWAKLGVSYFHVEANSVVAQFIDSDLFDGLTNRRGWYLYASKRLAPGIEVKMEFFDSDSIKNDVGFATSVANADRKRFRTDLVFSY
jgi:hypothetical protein